MKTNHENEANENAVTINDLFEKLKELRIRQEGLCNTHLHFETGILEEACDSDPEPEMREDEQSGFLEEDVQLHDAWQERDTNRRQQVFINEMIIHGSRRLAYQKAYPGVKDQTAHTNAYRLLAKPHIAMAIKEGLIQAKKDSLAALKKQFEHNMAADEKRAVLNKIIRGEYEVQKVKNGSEVVIEKPGIRDVLRAIALDNKMEEEWLQATKLPDSGRIFYDLEDEDRLRA
jgi:hypothetical protein